MKKTLLFVLSLAVALALTFLVREPQFGQSQTYVLFLMFFSIGLWVTEAIPPFSVGLFILAYLAFFLGNPAFNTEPQDIAKYVHTFSSSVIWLMLGGFFLASALSKTGLDADLLRFTLKVSGATPRRILIGLMATTMVASMLMSNTATTAMVIAAVMPLLNKLGRQSPFVVATLVGVPLAAAVGGMGTIIGTPPNILAAGILEEAGLGVDFLHWMYFGVPLALFLTALGCVALIRIFLKDNEPLPVEAFAEEKQEAGIEGLRAKRRVVIVVLAVTLLSWMTSSLHHVGVAMVAAIPIVFLTMTSVLDTNDVRAMPWDTLLLVAGGLALGLALQDTGLLSHYARKIIAMELGKLVVLCVFAFVTMLVSNIMSNTATATILIPLGMATLPEHRLEIALIIGFAASTAMFLPVSTPPNAIAFSTGLVAQKRFRIGGILIGLVGPAAVIAWVLLLS